MRRHFFARRVRDFLLAAAIGFLSVSSARSEEVQETQHLYLEVFINGAPARLVGNFLKRPDGSLAISPVELREIGLVANAQQPAATDGLIDLQRISGISYRYDHARQNIYIEAQPHNLAPRQYDAGLEGLRGSIVDRTLPVQPNSGAVLNYLLYGTTQTSLYDTFTLKSRQGTASAALDARVFGPLGVISQSGILSANTNSDYNSVRLDTTWSLSDPNSLITYRAGDLISGGLAWTRPVRLGGVQIQRTFSLRPDLITMPVPQLRGSAAVPSAVDVYVNNVRTFSQNVPAGPFEISNLPIISGPGTQRLVIRDAQGREIVADRPIYASTKLLRPGLYEYSAEAGLRRLNYGVLSDDYDREPVASGTLRRGISDSLTAEFHIEGGDRLFNGGAGIAFPMLWFGVGTLAVARSSRNEDSGTQFAASLELGLGGTRIFGRSQRTIGQYLDIASISPSYNPLNTGFLTGLRPPKELDQVAISVLGRFDPSSVSLSYTHLRDFSGMRYDIVGLSYSRPILDSASLFATAFRDFTGRGNTGFFAGLSWAFSRDISANTSVSANVAGVSAGIEVAKSQSQEPGTYGWRFREREGSISDRLAAGSYRTPFGRLAASVQQYGSDSRASGELEGAVAVAGGGVFATNRIDDSFAVVKVGAPDVEVSYENRPAGKTDSSGRLLVPNLRSYEPNTLSIDPRNLPVDAVVPRTKVIVVPAARSGATASFEIAAGQYAGEVSFQDTNGVPLPTGARGRVNDTREEFVVGYDGTTYIAGLNTKTSVTILLAGGECRADFYPRYTPGIRTKVAGVVCR